MSRSASERELHSFVMSVSELDLPSPVMFDESAGTFQQRTPKYGGHPDYVPPMTRRQNRKRRTRRQKKKCPKNQHQTDEGQKNEHIVPAEHEALETKPTSTNRDDRGFEALYALEHLPFFDKGPAEGQIIESSEKTDSAYALPDTYTPRERWTNDPFSHKFMSSRGNEYFCEIDEDYLTDRFNLTGLNADVEDYQHAIDLINDVFDAECDEERRERIEKSARHLYGLIHARYITTTRGLQKMVRHPMSQYTLYFPK